MKFKGIVILIIALVVSCNQSGFESVGNAIYQKIIQLPLEDLRLDDAEYFSAEVTFGKVGASPIHSFLLYHHNPAHLTSAEKMGDRLHPELLKILLSLKEGEKRIFRMPFSYIDDTFLTAFSDSSIASSEENFEISIHILKVFHPLEFAHHLMAMAQHNEISEIEAIEILLMNDTSIDYEKYDDVFIQIIENHKGRRIHKADSLILLYQTSLLDNKLLDHPTKLELVLGTTGQISAGLSKALSHCGCEDSVRIYMPSALAFGVQGSRSGIIPPKSPVVNHLRLHCTSKTDTSGPN